MSRVDQLPSDSLFDISSSKNQVSPIMKEADSERAIILRTVTTEKYVNA